MLHSNSKALSYSVPRKDCLRWVRVRAADSYARRTDDKGRQFMYVRFWEKTSDDPSDIPQDSWISVDSLERALDVLNRKVCNFKFNFNMKTRVSLSRK